MENFEPRGGDGQLGHNPEVLSQNYYQILDVDPRASRLDIREAYIRLKSTYTSGNTALYSLISEAEARENMARIDDAFRVLGDDVKRREFDERLGLNLNQAATSAPRFTNTTESGSVEDLTDVTLGDCGMDVRGTFDPAAERLNLVRSQTNDFHRQHQDPWKVEAALGVDAAHARDVAAPTSPSTRAPVLPAIKTRASGVSKEEVQAVFRELVSTGDHGDGDLYRRLRETAGVSDDEMQERTKVSIGYLRAIEGNRFERLPQAVFVKGFLRSYFRYLNVPDSEKMVNAYGARLHDWQMANRRS